MNAYELGHGLRKHAYKPGHGEKSRRANRVTAEESNRLSRGIEGKKPVYKPGVWRKKLGVRTITMERKADTHTHCEAIEEMGHFNQGEADEIRRTYNLGRSGRNQAYELELRRG